MLRLNRKVLAMGLDGGAPPQVPWRREKLAGGGSRLASAAEAQAGGALLQAQARAACGQRNAARTAILWRGILLA